MSAPSEFNAAHPYATPTPLITKINLTMSDKFPYVDLTMGLFRSHPELFSKTATTLLYALQAGTTYTTDSLVSDFADFITSSFILSKEEVAKNITNEDLADSRDFVYINSMMILFAYYLRENQVFYEFEPIFRPIKKSFDMFVAKRMVVTDRGEIKFDEFAPIAYTCNGDNILDLLPYIAYIYTFYLNGSPYTFHDAMPGDSLHTQFMSTLNSYCQSYYSALLADLGVTPASFVLNEHALYESVDTMSLQGMLNRMLDFNKLLELRNAEMNKSPGLLDTCISSQNRLDDSFIESRFNSNMSTLMQVIIDKNPFKKIYDSFPEFEPTEVSKGMQRLNMGNLMAITQYCVANGDKPFAIDREYKFIPIHNSVGNTEYISVHPQPNSIDTKIIGKQKLSSKIHSLHMSMKKPFSDADVILQMFIEYLRQIFIRQQQSFLDEPTIELDEPIKIDNSSFRDPQLQQTILNLIVNGMWKLNYSEMNLALEGLMKFNAKTKADIINILNLQYICEKVYNRLSSTRIIGAYVFSYLNDMVLQYLDGQGSLTKDALSSFNFMRYLSSFVLNTYDAQRGELFYDSLVSIGFTQTDEYARFVNLQMNTMNKYLEIDPIIQIPYIKGNNDSVELYSVGGLELYDRMKNSNPYCRARDIMRQTEGISEEIECFHRWIQDVDDIRLFELITNASSVTTITDMLNAWHERVKHDPPSMLNNYLFKLSDDSLEVTRKNYAYWIDVKLGDKFVYEVFNKYISFPAVSANISDNVFQAVRLIRSADGGFIPDEITKNSMKYSDTQYVPVLISDTTPIDATKYNVPIYKYSGGLDYYSMTFVNPVGYQLIELVLNSTARNKNSTVFLFTKAAVASRFQQYAMD